MELTTKVQRKVLGFRRAALGGLGALAAGAIGQALHFPWLLFVPMLMVIPEKWRERTRTRRVVVSRTHLAVGEEIIPRDALSNATVGSDDTRTWVTFEIDDGLLNVEAPDDKHARKLVRTLGMHETAMRMRLRDRHATAWWAVIAPILGIGLYATAVHFRNHPSSFMTLLGAIVVAVFIVDLSLRRVDVTVGIDGISVKGLRTTRFVPYEKVHGVDITGRRVRVTVEAGAPLEWDAIALVPQSKADVRARALVARIERARKHWGAKPAPPRIEAVGRGAFRQSEVPDEALWNALESGQTRPSDRVSAAAALRQRVADAGDIVRLRVAADVLASPARERVRAVLDADDANLERVVDELVRIDER